MSGGVLWNAFLSCLVLMGAGTAVCVIDKNSRPESRPSGLAPVQRGSTVAGGGFVALLRKHLYDKGRDGLVAGESSDKTVLVGFWDQRSARIRSRR